MELLAKIWQFLTGHDLSGMAIAGGMGGLVSWWFNHSGVVMFLVCATIGATSAAMFAPPLVDEIVRLGYSSNWGNAVSALIGIVSHEMMKGIANTHYADILAAVRRIAYERFKDILAVFKRKG